MENLKGLILSGGAGTRLRPITHTSAKQLVPVANKPVLFYGIEALVEAGVEEIGIIIAPETGDEIARGGRRRLRLRRGDHLHPAGRAARPRARRAHRGAVPGRTAVRDVPGRQPAARRDQRPRRGVPRLRARRPDPAHAASPIRSNYGVAELDGDAVVRLVEKPEDPPTDLALVGVYMFGPAIFEAARAIEPSRRGELEITDAIQRLIDGGQRVESHRVSGWWKDTGQLDDMLEANRLVLEDIERRVDGRAGRLAGRGPGRGRGGRPARALGGARAGDHRRGRADHATPTSAPTRRSTPGVSDRAAPRSSTRSCSPASSVCDLGTRMEASLLGRNVTLSSAATACRRRCG